MPKNKIMLFSLILILILSGVVFAFKVDGSSPFCLADTYDLYKKVFLSRDGRIIDYDRKGITTSEGQSYIMLQSFVMDDKPTFDLAYTWTKNNLRRKDNLFAWLWGKNPDGSYKIIDDNSASDADVDIAFALLLAYEKWGDCGYLQDAKSIILSIWANEVISVAQQLVLMPGVKQAQNTEKIEVNPSYFALYAFRYFQKYDELHDWSRLVDSSYYYIAQSMASTKTGLPPDWFLIKDGQVSLENTSRSNFSYDAIRVFARAYLDYISFHDERSIKILNAANFFTSAWETSGKFYTNYSPNGKPADNVEFTGSIAVLIPIISLHDEKTASELYQQKVIPYKDDKNYWRAKNDYYAKNLIFFGCYLYDKSCAAKREKNMRKNK